VFLICIGTLVRVTEVLPVGLLPAGVGAVWVGVWVASGPVAVLSP